MRRLVTAQEMRLLEKAYMESTGTSSEQLMQRAAQGLISHVIQALGGAEGRTCVFACGCGGNGGDGYAAAALFAMAGGRAIVLEVQPEATVRADTIAMRKIALGIESIWFTTDICTMPRPSAWVDCIFGIGLRSAPDAHIAQIIARMQTDRESGSLVFACDIPTGLDADTGIAPGACVQADVTVTFAYAKPGHYLEAGMDACGQVEVCSIGIEDEAVSENAVKLLEPSDVAPVCAKRLHNTHKGTYGHLLMVAGSFGMAGAAAFAAGAALRSGVGLVSIACVRSIVPILQTLVPGAMCIPLEEEEGAISPAAMPALENALRGKSAVVIGPGCSTRCTEKAVKAVLRSGLPCLLDADALNILSAHRELLPLLHEKCLITPHPGEAARLLSLPNGAIARAKALAGLGCAALYKGAATVIVQGEGVAISVSGTPGMAKGGSGDVLAGIAGALLARGYSAFFAGSTASEIHGLAGMLAAQRLGETGMTAQDIAEALPEVYLHAGQ